MLAVLPQMDFTPPPGRESWTELGVELTSEEVQRYLGVKPARLRQWVARGNVKRIGSASYDMGSVMNYLWRRQRDGKPTCQP